MTANRFHSLLINYFWRPSIRWYTMLPDSAQLDLPKPIAVIIVFTNRKISRYRNFWLKGDKRIRPSTTMWREWKKRAEVRRLTSLERFICERKPCAISVCYTFSDRWNFTYMTYALPFFIWFYVISANKFILYYIWFAHLSSASGKILE